MISQAQLVHNDVDTITQRNSLGLGFLTLFLLVIFYDLVRNILRIGISSIAYLRHLFPEDCFQDHILAGMNMKILTSTTEESRLLVSWLECGVFEALEKQYVYFCLHLSLFLLSHQLRSLVFGIYLDPTKESSLIECYTCIPFLFTV